METAAVCVICKTPCILECGKCFVVLQYLGQKHNCPDTDDGYFDELESNLPLCEDCEHLDIRAELLNPGKSKSK